MSWWGGASSTPAVDPNIYGNTAKAFTDKDFDAFIAQCDDLSPEWTVAYENKDDKVTVWQKAGVGTINILRAKKVVTGLAAATLYDVLHDHAYRKTWDENMIEGAVLEMLDNTTEVGYYAGKMPAPLGNRDFVNQRSWQRRLDQRTWLIVNHSVIYAGKPETPGFVRAWSYQTGYLIRETSEGTEFIYCTQTDPKGWIPGWVVNTFASVVGPSYLAKMTKVASEYLDWVAANGGDDRPKPWLNDGL